MNIPITIRCFLLLLMIWSYSSCNNPTSEKTETITSEPQEESGMPAIKALDEKIAANPNDPTLYAARAAIYYNLEDFPKAVKDMLVATSMDSSNTQYFHLLADAYLDSYDSKKAVLTLEKAVELFPDSLNTMLKLSEFQHILELYMPSMKTLNKVLEKQPTNDEAYYMLGRNFKALGDTTKALAGFAKAAGYNSDHIDAYIELGILSDRMNNPIAEQYFDNALRIDSTNGSALYGKAFFYQNQNRLTEAIDLYHKIIIYDHNHLDAYFNTGILYLEQDSLKQAYTHFDLAIKIEPTFVLGYYYRGLTKEMQGNKKGALADFNQTLVFDPNFERAKEAANRVR